MDKIKMILGWVGVVFFGILIFGGGFSIVPLSLLVLNILPVKKWQEFKRNKLKINTPKSIVIGVVLFVIAMLTFPTQGNEDKDIDDSSSSIAEIVEETQSKNTVITTESSDSVETTVITTVVTNITTNIAEETIAEGSTFNVHFIDVGQADAALIECDEHYMLIDGGNKEDSDIMYSVLKDKGISNLDIVVGTHAHEDHIGGLAGALNYATADVVLCPVTEYDSKAFEDFKKYADSRGNGIVVPNIGDTYKLGSANIRILGVNCESDVNNTSIVLKIEYGETSFIFTGDADRETEQKIINSEVELSATVLKVGHHGSDTSTSYVWLNEIMPQYAVISVGKNNSYNHPTDEVLSRLHDADVTTFRTDLNGDIYATSDGKSVTFTTDKSVGEDEIFKAGVVKETTQTPVEESKQDMQEEVVQDNLETYDYVVNTNTGKFHKPSCSSAKKIKESNRWEYNGTRQEMIDMGYEPCKNCNP